MSDREMVPLLRPVCWVKGHVWSKTNEAFPPEARNQTINEYRACWRCGKVTITPRLKP